MARLGPVWSVRRGTLQMTTATASPPVSCSERGLRAPFLFAEVVFFDAEVFMPLFCPLLVFFVFAFGSGVALGHPGNTDSTGCHTDRRLGKRHCHAPSAMPASSSSSESRELPEHATCPPISIAEGNRIIRGERFSNAGGGCYQCWNCW